MFFHNMESQKEPDKILTQESYRKAVKMLKENVVTLECYRAPVLTTGKGYPGIWLEHNHDSLFYAEIDPEVAKNSHRIFYHFQAEDGLFPAYICKWPQEEAYRIGYGHLQTVYPLAASAYEIAIMTGDTDFLQESYDACSRYDQWIRLYRDTRKTGLVEMFCGFDTGHDNSARIQDLPKICNYGNARFCPDNKVLPIIAPDLSATVYRARMALADMADKLGKIEEGQQWRRLAEDMRQALFHVCYDEKDEFFYDVAADGSYRRYFSEHIFRLFVNGAVSQNIFENIFHRYIMSENYFNSKFPFASVGISDPAFCINLQENNWNGMSQTHTALETLFWMEQYGQGAVLEDFMRMWVNLCNQSEMICSQEVNPFTGKFSTKAPAFTTTLIMYVEFVKKLHLIE